MLNGKKAYSGALICAAAAALEYFYPGTGQTVLALGAALGIAGIRHKQNRDSQTLI